MHFLHCVGIRIIIIIALSFEGTIHFIYNGSVNAVRLCWRLTHAAVDGLRIIGESPLSHNMFNTLRGGATGLWEGFLNLDNTVRPYVLHDGGPQPEGNATSHMTGQMKVRCQGVTNRGQCRKEIKIEHTGQPGGQGTYFCHLHREQGKSGGH